MHRTYYNGNYTDIYMCMYIQASELCTTERNQSGRLHRKGGKKWSLRQTPVMLCVWRTLEH